VAEPKQVDELFDRIKEVLGGLDVLVNNAGIGGPTAAMEDISVEDWNRTMAVNMNGHFYCARRAVPLSKASSWGRGSRNRKLLPTTGSPLRLPLRSRSEEYPSSEYAVTHDEKETCIPG
jgi:NAD(P)-dependent dehydrogenase (short-subunit alcohol dehydrogenase family)